MDHRQEVFATGLTLTHVKSTSPGRSFAAYCKVDRNQLVLAWQATAWWSAITRPSQLQEAAARKRDAGIARIDLDSGRVELGPFAAAPQHFYLVRSIEPIGDRLPAPHVTALQAGGPFDEPAECALMQREHFDIIVTKNSGGAATYAKIAAARALGLPVVIVARPEKPAVANVTCVTAALNWIDAQQRVLV